jgi:uncharacterized protein DUF1573
MLRHWYCLLLGLAVASPASAASWSDGVFAELSKDFGTVPRGPMLSHPFHVRNTTNTPIHIANVRVSCGCVSATAVNNQIMPGEETAILAHMDTTRFSGVKTVTIFVTFDQPHQEEVRLWVQANSRDDVTVSPDAINFGQIRRNVTPSANVTVTFLGNGQWQVQGVQCDSNYVQVGVKELRRTGGDVSYSLSAQLRSDAPVGKWYTDIWLKTNNPSTPRVRVPVNVEIESVLSISPALVDLGQVKVGGQTERKIIVRGVAPFEITNVQGVDQEIAVQETTAGSRPVHVLSVTLQPRTPGELKRQLRIITNLKEEGEIEFQTRAHIAP